MILNYRFLQFLLSGCKLSQYLGKFLRPIYCLRMFSTNQIAEFFKLHFLKKKLSYETDFFVLHAIIRANQSI